MLKKCTIFTCFTDEKHEADVEPLPSSPSSIVYTFKTSPCMPAPRAHVFPWCRYTRLRFGRTHGHVFGRTHTTHHTAPQDKTQHHTETETEREREEQRKKTEKERDKTNEFFFFQKKSVSCHQFFLIDEKNSPLIGVLSLMQNLLKSPSSQNIYHNQTSTNHEKMRRLYKKWTTPPRGRGPDDTIELLSRRPDKRLKTQRTVSGYESQGKMRGTLRAQLNPRFYVSSSGKREIRTLLSCFTHPRVDFLKYELWGIAMPCANGAHARESVFRVTPATLRHCSPRLKQSEARRRRRQVAASAKRDAHCQSVWWD